MAKRWLAGWLMAMACAAPAHAQTVEYIHTDALGSPVAVTNSAGQVIERREYEPYGTQLAPTLSDGPGYTGHVQDAATGLVYMQQRYYDPIIGRFLSVDPIAADTTTAWNFNRYNYAANNPYKFTDPDGRACDSPYSPCNGEGAIPRPIQHQSNEDQLATEIGLGVAVAVASRIPLVAAVRILTKIPISSLKQDRPLVAGVRVGKTPSETRVALEKAGFEGKSITNKAGTESGTIHRVPGMTMDVRVMSGGPNHGPRVVTNRQGTSQPVNPANGRNFGNVPRAEQQLGSHIKLRPDK